MWNQMTKIGTKKRIEIIISDPFFFDLNYINTILLSVIIKKTGSPIRNFVVQNLK
jgi:hypothetical protein